MGWAIALHGGAGEISRSLPLDKKQPREATLRRCLDLGISLLKSGRTPLDVVELVVSIFFLILKTTSLAMFHFSS